MKCFRVQGQYYNGYDMTVFYEYRLGYRNLGKVLKEMFDNEEEVTEIAEIIPTLKALWVCWKKTNSSYKNKCI